MFRQQLPQGEKQAARERAEAVAKSCGMPFDEAMKASTPPAPKAIVNIFKGFDNWCEDREPGYKAAKAAERSKKTAERRE